LIGIGLLFLARNVFPELQLLDYLAKYWPLLLVIWGGLRLLEILVWAASSKPLPARGLSRGEWVLIVFLCFVGVSLHAVRGCSVTAAAFRLGWTSWFREALRLKPTAAQAISTSAA